MPRETDDMMSDARADEAHGSCPEDPSDQELLRERLRQARERLREPLPSDEPFFFYAEDVRLFGCHHAPVPSARLGKAGVVLCYPIAQEYLQAHRAFRQLAIRLARSGFHVLRFDYFGTGDSEGDAKDANLVRWRTDLDGAIYELKARAALSRVYLIGLRLGASLAAVRAAERGDISRAVFWEPVVTGRAHLEELESRHQDALRYFFRQPSRRSPSVPREALGFPIGDQMLKELEDLDLVALTRRPSKQSLVIEANERTATTSLVQRLQSMGCSTKHRILSGPQVWTEGIDKGLVPQRVLESMVSWLCEAAQ